MNRPTLSLADFKLAVKLAYDILHLTPQAAIRRVVLEMEAKGFDVPKEYYTEAQAKAKETKMNHFTCDTCGRDMGDIDVPQCHECEQGEIDALEGR
jgi:hypothetical protein